jgi:hypothetical protein
MHLSRKTNCVVRKTRRRNLNIETLEDRSVFATLVALTNVDQVITFDSAAPTIIITANAITGMGQGEDMLGITTRPATGQLYGLTNVGRIYTIDAYTGVATFKTALSADGTDATAPFTRLLGASFEIDFNPVVDRMRVVSDADQNLRINVDTGATITDTTLAYIASDPRFGKDPNIVGAGYQNPDNDAATGTTLFGIDSRFDILVTQNPANDGTLTTVGSLGLNTNTRVGFDIGLDGTAYATLTPQAGGVNNGTDSALYTINLATGAATLVGKIGGGGYTVLNVQAMLPARPIFAVTLQGNLVSYNAVRPDVLTSKVAISGLNTGETIVGIDFRPSTGLLYGVSSVGRIYVINTTTGAAVAVPSLSADPTDGTSPFSAIAGTSLGFDFNPVVDRLRITTEADENLRANVGTGLTFTDTTLAYGGADVNTGANPNIVASAYLNNFAGTATTTLYGIDSNLDVLVTQNPANDGTLLTVGSLGVNASAVTSFDISSGGIAYAAITLVGGTNTGFYSINLATGAATLIGTIGATTVVGGETVIGMSVAPALVQFATSFYAVGEAIGQATIGVIRTGDTSSAVTVNFDASSSVATAGIDFTPVSASLAFAAGVGARTFSVPIINDLIMAEAYEAIDLSLSNPAGGGGATLGANILAQLLIADND